MMKRKKSRLILYLIAIIMIFGEISVGAVDLVSAVSKVEATAREEMISPALDHLAARTDMAVATVCGNEYTFSENVFARSLNVSDVSSIQVVSLPAVTDGELMIGSTRVSEGQKISAASLPMLSYVPANDKEVGETSFTFSPNGAAYAITCHVYVLNTINYSPTVSVASAEALNVSTHRDFVGYGKLNAYDPEGDPMVFEIVSRPTHGLVILTDASQGEYVYLPKLNYTGSDKFSYVARDKYGNYSASAQVNVQVEAPSVSVVYADMEGREEYNAAISMTEAGIMQGTALDGKEFFYPDQEVSRVEFLTMAMQSIRVKSVPTVEDTGFADDEEIPGDAKGYVSAAYSLGYIKGEANAQGDLCFNPNETITKAEAAVMLRRMLPVASTALTPVFADASEIPTWASEAIATLSSMGIIQSRGGAISPQDTVTRGQAAMMLSALRRVE